jgi:hypothetical protein
MSQRKQRDLPVFPRARPPVLIAYAWYASCLITIELMKLTPMGYAV